MNVLITGPSGAGKSALGRQLGARGCNVVDADRATYQGTSIAYFRSNVTGEGVDPPRWPLPTGWTAEHDWVWRTGLIQRQLEAWRGQTNVVCGDARNREDAYPLFDVLLFLATDDETLRRRIAGREDHDFGKAPAEFEWIVDENRRLVAHAQASGGVLIDASRSVDQLADEVLGLLAPKA